MSTNNDKSGFFDLPYLGICVSPEHNIPSHLHIPQGKGYKHVCPMCGAVQTIIPHQVVYGIGAGWPHYKVEEK